MGHIFTADGLKIDQDKVKAITSIPLPDGPQGVRRFLEMANFVSRFVPNMSKLSAPLRSLTEQDNEWVWDPVPEKSFQDVKEAIARSSTLKFFNPSEHTTVQCDSIIARAGSRHCAKWTAGGLCKQITVISRSQLLPD